MGSTQPKFNPRAFIFSKLGRQQTDHEVIASLQNYPTCLENSIERTPKCLYHLTVGKQDPPSANYLGFFETYILHQTFRVCRGIEIYNPKLLPQTPLLCFHAHWNESAPPPHLTQVHLHSVSASPFPTTPSVIHTAICHDSQYTCQEKEQSVSH